MAQEVLIGFPASFVHLWKWQNYGKGRRPSRSLDTQSGSDALMEKTHL